MPKLKQILLSPLIVASVLASIVSVATHGPDHFHKNEHLLHSDRRYLWTLKTKKFQPGSNKAKRRKA